MKTNNPLWHYSLQLYAQKNVERFCLDYQKQHNVNINLLLFCCWAGAQGVVLDQADLKQLGQLITVWDQQVVQKIRALRRGLSTIEDEATKAIKEQLLGAELQAEQVEQDRLYQWWLELSGKESVDSSAAVLCNLNNYLAVFNCEPLHEDHWLVQAAKSVKMQSLQ